MALSQEEVQERLKNLTPEQMQELVKQQCIFCKIVAGDIPSYKVYEDNNFLAFLDINPANPGHTIVIPKKHYSVIPQIPDQEAAAYFILIKRLTGIIYEATGAVRMQLMQFGIDVPHIHLHIIPRFEEDGQDTLYSPFTPKKLTEEQLKEIQAKILKRLKEPTKQAPKTVPKEEEPKKPKLPRIKPRLP